MVLEPGAAARLTYSKAVLRTQKCFTVAKRPTFGRHLHLYSTYELIVQQKATFPTSYSSASPLPCPPIPLISTRNENCNCVRVV